MMCRPVKLDGPTLEEILADPIVRLLMARDGVDADEVRPIMKRLWESRFAVAKR